MPRAIPPPVLLAVLLPCVDETWMNFFTKVLSRFASTPRLQPTVSFEVPPESNVTRLRIEETRTALRELGLEENLEP
jgi:hypothetical protein